MAEAYIKNSVLGQRWLLYSFTDMKIATKRQIQQTYPTIGPPWSKLYTCLGFSRYLNFLSTLEEERKTEERTTQIVKYSEHLWSTLTSIAIC